MSGRGLSWTLALLATPALAALLSAPAYAAAAAAAAGRQSRENTWMRYPVDLPRVTGMDSYHCLTATDSNTLYALAANGYRRLCKLTPSDGTWTHVDLTSLGDLGSAEMTFMPGSAPGSGSLIITRGGMASSSLTLFHAYDITTGSITPLPNPPNPPFRDYMGNGVAYDVASVMVAAGGKLYVMATLGWGSRIFLEYDPAAASGQEWTRKADPVSYINSYGFSMCASPWDGALYALQAGVSVHLWRYDRQADRWISSENSPELASLPQAVFYEGVTLAAGPAGLLYCFTGASGSEGDRRAFYRYDIARKLWTRLADAPANVADWASLTIPAEGRFAFASQGYGSNQIWRYTIDGIRPEVAALAQTTLDGVDIAPGAAISSSPHLSQRSFVAKARIGSPDPLIARCRIQLQVHETGIAGALVADLTGEEVARDTDVAFTVDTLQFGRGYRWQMRGFDEGGVASEWMPFGTVALDEADVVCPANNAPVEPEPALLDQREGASGHSIPAGGTIRDRMVTFHIPSASDIEGDRIRLEVEIGTVGRPFSGVATVIGPFVASGDDASAPAEPGQGAHSWQARLTDDLGKSTAWVEFGAAGGATDFMLIGGSLGNRPCGATSPQRGMALMLFAALIPVCLLRRASMKRRMHPGMLAGCAILVLASPAVAAPQSGPDTWSDPSLPQPAGLGVGVVATGPGTFYVAPGNNTTSFYRCDVAATPVWTKLASVPDTVHQGGDMAWLAGSNSIYLIAHGTMGSPSASQFYRYDMAADAWSPDDPMPSAPDYDSGLAATSSKVYLLVSGGFFEFDPSKAAGTRWRRMANPPTFMTYGVSLAWPGPGDFLYALPGNYSLDFWRYSITLNRWVSSKDSPAIVAPSPAGSRNGSALVTGPGGSLYCLPGMNWTFYRYDTAGPTANTWTPLASTPAMYECGAIAFPPGSGGDILFIIRGAPLPGAPDLWRYSVAQDRFLGALPPFPARVDSGGCLAGVGNGNDLYALRGDSTREFHRHSISTGAWTKLEDTPGNVRGGGSLAHAGGDSIYATGGDGKTSFWRYSIAGHSWTAARPLPAPMTDGGKIVHVGGGIIFAIRGASTSELYRYDAATDEWEAKAGLPTNIGFGLGAALAYPGSGGTLYAFAVYGSPVLLGYSISGDAWTLLAPPPVNLLGQGASICHPGRGNSLYAFTGGQSSKLLAYSMTGNAWTDEADAPGVIGSTHANGGGGAALAWPGAGLHLYALQGNASTLFWRYEIDNAAPLPPGGLSQFRMNGSLPLPQGGVTPEAGFIAAAFVGDPDGDEVRLHVEVQDVGTPFTGVATAVSAPAVIGGVASVTVPYPLDRDCHWQAWTTDARGAVSPSISRGTHPEDLMEIDFRTKSDAPPFVQSPGQWIGSTEVVLAPGATVLEGDGVTFRAILADPDDSDQVRLEIEIRRVGVPFGGEATASSRWMVNGRKAEATVQLSPGSYAWRCRAVDHLLAGSAWSEFGSGSAADFVVVSGGSDGGTCLHSARPGAGASWAMVALLAIAVLRGRQAVS